MSKIDEQIKKLKERELQLEREKRKIEFLAHILDSARNYEHADFKEVKQDVVALLAEFTERASKTIEDGGQSQVEEPKPSSPYSSESGSSDSRPVSPKPRAEATSNVSVSEKMNFAMENRHLSGKIVTVANDKNLTVKGQVVGLDAPYVFVKTDTGPVIKVPLNAVSLHE